MEMKGRIIGAFIFLLLVVICGGVILFSPTEQDKNFVKGSVYLNKVKRNLPTDTFKVGKNMSRGHYEEVATSHFIEDPDRVLIAHGDSFVSWKSQNSYDTTKVHSVVFETNYGALGVTSQKESLKVNFKPRNPYYRVTSKRHLLNHERQLYQSRYGLVHNIPHKLRGYVLHEFLNDKTLRLEYENLPLSDVEIQVHKGLRFITATFNNHLRDVNLDSMKQVKVRKMWVTDTSFLGRSVEMSGCSGCHLWNDEVVVVERPKNKPLPELIFHDGTWKIAQNVPTNILIEKVGRLALFYPKEIGLFEEETLRLAKRYARNGSKLVVTHKGKWAYSEFLRDKADEVLGLYRKNRFVGITNDGAYAPSVRFNPY